MRHSSPSVFLVIAVCALCVLVILEVLFMIFGVPTEVRLWVLGASVLAPMLYFLIMRFVRSRVTPRR